MEMNGQVKEVINVLNAAVLRKNSAQLFNYSPQPVVEEANLVSHELLEVS